MHQPSYLRVVINARCTLSCSYCHQEGDPATAALDGLPTAALLPLLQLAVENGVQKLKFLGGEPLLRADLPEIIASLRQRSPRLDISLITGGVARPGALNACFDAGLSRANLSIHGWSAAAFRERTTKGGAAWATRNATLDLLRSKGRFLKLNYVYRGPHDEPDLAALLSDLAGAPVVISVLDDLSNPALGPDAVIAALLRLRGAPTTRRAEPDPHSLPTLRLGWGDGLEVEVKDHHLGEVAPWTACGTCPVRGACREGITALRLSHDGQLRPCMDRPDLSVALHSVWSESGPRAAAAAWRCAIAGWTTPARRLAA